MLRERSGAMRRREIVIRRTRQSCIRAFIVQTLDGRADREYGHSSCMGGTCRLCVVGHIEKLPRELSLFGQTLEKQFRFRLPSLLLLQ